MSINKFRGFLYLTAKILGDVQAGAKASHTRSTKPISKRIARRLTGRLLGKLFK